LDFGRPVPRRGVGLSSANAGLVALEESSLFRQRELGADTLVAPWKSRSNGLVKLRLLAIHL
jgi:hypothetical protein